MPSVLISIVEVVTALVIHMVTYLFQIKQNDVKVFNLMSMVNETSFLVQHKFHECKYRLNRNARNLKPKWSHSKYRC